MLKWYNRKPKHHLRANTAHGGKSPYPYGLLFLNGDLSIVSEPPASLRGVPLAEILPVDGEDPRAAKLLWNQSGTEATFAFASVGNLWRIEPPEGAALWFDAKVLTDTDGLPAILVPLGQHIQTAATWAREIAAAQEQAETSAPTIGQAANMHLTKRVRRGASAARVGWGQVAGAARRLHNRLRIGCWCSAMPA